jgi:hypothetical protein
MVLNLPSSKEKLTFSLRLRMWSELKALTLRIAVKLFLPTEQKFTKMGTVVFGCFIQTCPIGFRQCSQLDIEMHHLGT